MSDAMDDEAFAGTCPTCGQSYLQAEIARLKEQLSHGAPAIEELTREREEYRMRWLGSMTPEEAALIRDENVRLRIAGRRLESAAQDVYLPEEPDAAMWQELRDAAQAMRIACGDEQDAHK